MPSKAAVIDIGSNSIRYLGRGGEKRLITTRLAESIVETGRLSDAAIARSIDALSFFASLAAEEGLKPYAYATSAVRDADDESRSRFLALAGAMMPVRVLSGDEEARLALIGAGIADKEDWGLIDLGGGSCQLVSASFATSAPMGCVRAKDICSACGSNELSSLKQAVFSSCEGLFVFPRIRMEDWIGVGGTITTLAALSLGLETYDAHAVENSALTIESIERLMRSLFDIGDEKRRQIPLLARRHDVIIPGALVLLYAMRGIGIRTLHPSNADGMEGYRKYIEADI